MADFTLGSDPELFLKKDGKHVSAIGLIGGTKEHPKPIKELSPRGFSLQEDNVLLEYNTPPASSLKRWSKYHSSVLSYIRDMLAAKGLEYAIDASALMPKEELRDPKAGVFGCDPDFNAWTLRINPKPRSSNPFLRSAGGHVHIGISGTKTQKIDIIRKLDATLGLWAVIKDPDDRRKELYGTAGACRFKPYGVEYRVLSNFWLKNGYLTECVWYIVANALDIPSSVYMGKEDAIQHAINFNKKELARDLLPRAITSLV